MKGNAERAIQSGPCDLTSVRGFYERRPYPAPVISLDQHRELYSNPECLRAQFHLLWPTKQLFCNREILIAGCGTSQAAAYALREPNARITGIDISKASLTHTLHLQEKYKLDNLILRQMSILDVQRLGQDFDQIVCTGVLHHLPDADAGLLSLRNVLKPDGAIQIMVYAQYGRAGIYMMREYCRILGITASDQELLALGMTLGCLTEDHPLTSVLKKRKDFHYPDALADALLHPQERAFSVPQIYEWLERCEMRFGRWIEQAPYSPECGALAKTPHAERLCNLPEPVQHAALELFRGAITQHHFVAYRVDAAIHPQPIHFDGEQWRSYVPIRLPWAICIHENLPAGTAALLLNQAHKQPDLILKLTCEQYRLLKKIDGKQTLGEIIRNSPMEESCAREFVRQLWQYDQIVFDATRASAVMPNGSSAPHPFRTGERHNAAKGKAA